jgi:hypothetical protein
MVRLGNEAQLDAGFGPFGDSANLDARLVHGFALNIPHEHLSDVGHVESHFGPFRDSASIGTR